MSPVRLPLLALSVFAAACSAAPGDVEAPDPVNTTTTAAVTVIVVTLTAGPAQRGAGPPSRGDR